MGNPTATFCILLLLTANAMVHNMKKMLFEIPKPVKRFLAVGIVIFLIWKLLYHIWLQPMQWPDRPLVNAIANHTCSGMNLFYADKTYSYKTISTTHGLRENKSTLYAGSKALIRKNDKPVLSIVPNCNGLELMILFAGFIIAFPGQWKTKLWFIPVGMVAIHLVNVLRSMALTQIAAGQNMAFFDFAHHYLFSLTIYLFIFLLWTMYIRYFSNTKGSIT